MNTGVRASEQLTGHGELGQACARELEALVGDLQGFTNEEHHDDGTHADITADSVSSAGGFREHGRLARAGEWVVALFDLAFFSGSGSMTWVPVAANTSVSYTWHGDSLVIQVLISGSTVGGSVGTDLRILLPYGLKATRTAVVGAVRISDNGSTGTWGLMLVSEGDTHLIIRTTPAITPANWTLSAAATTVQGTTTPFQVNL